LQAIQAEVLHIRRPKSLCPITKLQLLGVVKGNVSGGSVGDNRRLRSYAHESDKRAHRLTGLQFTGLIQILRPAK